jgi:8-oxo-dGTP pyrophosphatase MutT (NUDIX family)
MLLLFFKNDVPHVVLTKRTDKVATHKGEVCFPGGTHEVEDASLLDTALRETSEELGFDARNVTLLARLDDAITLSSNFVISPFVTYISAPPVFQPDAYEVAEVLDVPLPALLEASSFHRELVDTDGQALEVDCFRYGNYQIWGATAKILRQFLEMYKEQSIQLPAKPTASGKV